MGASSLLLNPTYISAVLLNYSISTEKYRQNPIYPDQGNISGKFIYNESYETSGLISEITPNIVYNYYF